MEHIPILMEKTTEHTTMEMSTEGTAIRIGDENGAHSNKNWRREQSTQQ
jgi:hypothetical protein